MQTLTKTRIGNYLRRHMLGDQPTFRQGFKEGIAFVLKHQPAVSDERTNDEPVALTYQSVADTMNALWNGTTVHMQIAQEMANRQLYTRQCKECKCNKQN